MTNESNTQPRPSRGSMEEAEKIMRDDSFTKWVRQWPGFQRYLKGVALALDQAKAEGAERVVRAVETACGVGASFARSKDWTIGFDDARGMTVAAARQALQEEKGEK